MMDQFTPRNPRLQARCQLTARSGYFLFFLNRFCDQLDAKRTYHFSNCIELRLGCSTERFVEALATQACRLSNVCNTFRTSCSIERSTDVRSIVGLKCLSEISGNR